MPAARGVPLSLSFRARLTLSYTILTAMLLTVAVGAFAAFVFARAIQSTMNAVDEAASRARAVAAAHWFESDERIAERIALQPHVAGVRVTLESRVPPPPQSGPGALIGVDTRIVKLDHGELHVGPDRTLYDTFASYGVFFALAEIVSVVAAWWLARSFTQEALAPLATVTEELRRFGAGDFAPSVLETRDRDELGDLVAAYNAAAAQVVAAFSERQRTEQHLREFLGEAGHEMRTPLTVVSAYLELLDAGGKTGARPAPEMLQRARTQMRRLRNLVERVMALARMEASHRNRGELLDLVEVTQDAIATVKAVRGGTIRLTHEADDVVVLAEPWELQEAVRNLIDNAVVYSGGRAVDVSIAVAGRQIVLRVRDRGPGIHDHDRGRLFQHFFRGEASAGLHGSGLGLAIVARAAARLGGSIALEDAGRPGGATFRLTLPIYEPAPVVKTPVRIG